MKNLNKCILFYCLSIMFACNNTKPSNKSDTTVGDIYVCTELYGDIEIKSKNDKKIKAAALKEYLWPYNGNKPLELNVKFMNGSEFQINKVKEYVKQWTVASNDKIRFVYNNNQYAHIRVQFIVGGSNSYIGSYANRISQNMPTMIFGWISEGKPEVVIKQVVLHEFGHALGLIHEHQHPDANIPWNKSAVYSYYRQTQIPPWDSQMVESNIFNRYTVTSINSNSYDPFSIMHYAIPSAHTIGGYSTPWNSELSKLDIELINNLYKKVSLPCSNGECCYDERGRRIMCP